MLRSDRNYFFYCNIVQFYSEQLKKDEKVCFEHTDLTLIHGIT